MYEEIDDTGRVVKCRKRYQCEWCNGWIEVGEQAVVRIYKWDGEFQNARQHPECYKALEQSMAGGLMWDNEFEPGNQSRGCLVGIIKEKPKC